MNRWFNSTLVYIKNINVMKTHYRSKMSSCTIDKKANRIIWMDLEMTGLDIDRDHIMELACLVTDSDLNVVATGPDIVIHQPDHILNSMNEWCKAHHGESGLTKQCKESRITLREAENQVLKFVASNVPEKCCPLGGNSVYMDRLFLRKYMPQLNNYLHYRNIDVSTIKELVKWWYPKEYSRVPNKKFAHRCLSDIMDSIEELKYYKHNVFK
ncbi:oligoribonuclease, mitochondrial isoform X1 [Leptidea sinapis]|uniref:oligoribonuclease, mitochondrial isoform X1 n=2 Tax=Leptidea sinapis TaxID=189913 RepID=UPI0021C41F44|nr:oligoribonuclease, mitochondrial isoform X1 [Leptidea sinapis]XP_050678876.1 oligoribonuclease, mitochondrial isoform X1 [Leptidea sinapis]